MTQIEQIKAEIERIDDECKGKHYYIPARQKLDELFSFIESLEKEHYYTKRNAIFDECVKNCDPKIMKKVSDEIDKMLEKEPKIKGWVVRDYDSEVFFHCKKPQKFHEEGIEYWANGGYRFMVPQSMQSAFWELCTTDEPIEVELTISRVKTE